MSRFFLLALALTYTYVNSMPLRPEEGKPVVHNHYNRLPKIPGIKGLKEQIVVSAGQSNSDDITQSNSDDITPITPDLPVEPHRAPIAPEGIAASACTNGFQTYSDTTWNLMGLPFTIAYTLQQCIDICNNAGSTACVAAVWYNGNACVAYTQAQANGQVMSPSPDPNLPRTLITRCTATTTAPVTQAPTQAATKAPTQAPTSAPTTSSSNCGNGFITYTDSTYDLMGLPYAITYSANGCLNICMAMDATTCAAAVWYNGNACVTYTAAQAAGKVIMKSPDPNLPRTLVVRCSSTPVTQAPATQAPTQAATKAPTQAPTNPPATPAPATPAPATQAPATQAPTVKPDTSAPGSNGLTYGGGSVMTNPVKVYLVYYGSWTTQTAQQSMSIINTFVTNLGTSAWWNIQTTYYYPNPSTGVRTYVQNGVTLGGYVIAPIDPNNGGTSITDTNIETIISKQINSGFLPYNNDGVYMVISSAEVYNSGFCSSDCGWHSAAYVQGSSRIMRYGWIGDATTQCPSSCQAFGSRPSPNGVRGADGIISVLAHEIAETVSDPLLSAWVDSSTYTENADKCAWNFISNYYTSTGAPANMNIGGKDYLIQSNWKNRDGGGCVLHL